MTDVIIYDRQWNANEWFVTVAGITAIIVTYMLPARFSRKRTILYFLCGLVYGGGFDLTLGTIPVSFYDIDDSSHFEVWDFVSLWMYGGFSYVFFYIYDALKLKAKYVPLYIFAWALLAIGIEAIGVIVGLYHYQHGFWIGVSFEIYLLVLSSWIVFFHLSKHYDHSNATFHRKRRPCPIHQNKRTSRGRT